MKIEFSMPTDMMSDQLRRVRLLHFVEGLIIQCSENGGEDVLNFLTDFHSFYTGAFAPEDGRTFTSDVNDLLKWIRKQLPTNDEKSTE